MTSNAHNVMPVALEKEPNSEQKWISTLLFMLLNLFMQKKPQALHNHRLTVSRLISEAKQALESIFKHTCTIPFFWCRGNNEETTGMLVKVLKINTNLQTSKHNDITWGIIVLQAERKCIAYKWICLNNVISSE